MRRETSVVGVAGLVVVGLSGLALGAGPAASISTQGTIVFCDGTYTANRGTYRMNPDGTNIVRISTDIYANDVSRGQTPMTVLMNAGADIQALPADGSGGSVPLLVSATNESCLRFSLDGAKIAFRTAAVGEPYTISTADVVRDGTGAVTGIANAQVVWSGSTQIWGLDFSRDASRIVFSASNGTAPDLFILTLADSTVEQITSTPDREESPRWSPTDDRIAYLRRADGGTAVCSLLTIDAGTRAVKTVLSGSSNQYASAIGGLSWAPGATHLVTVVGGYKKPVDLYQFPSTGGKGVNLTGGTSLQPTLPCWGW